MTEAHHVCVRPLDASGLRALEGHFPSADGCKHRDRFAQQQLGYAAYLIAWVGEEPVGHLLLRFGGSGNAQVVSCLGVCPHIEDLFVLPRWRSRGFGTRLLAAAEGTARARAYPRIGLSVAANNAGARRLYARLGYRDSGLGEYPTSGTYLTAAGEPRPWFDMSLYLVKELGD